MRISSTSFYTASLPAIQSQQTAIARLTQQIAADKNYLAPKDDPVATSRILELTDSIALRDQYLSNIQKAELSLQHEETILNELQSSLTEVQGLLYESSPSQDLDFRTQMGAQIANLYLHIKDLANSKDSGGDYVFSGFETATQPYLHTPAYPTVPADSPDTLYQGTYPASAGLRTIEVDNGRRIQVNDNLAGVFQVEDPAAAPDPAHLDLLEAMDQAAITLSDPNAAQADLDAAIAVVNTALQRLETVQTRLAGRMVSLNDIKESQLALKLQDQNALGALQDLDEAAAIVELKQRETTLQASMQAFASISELSLFNYL
jgi:flagellar hook-associated protein 3 FlgL